MYDLSSTIRPRRLSFSGLGLLMSTPSFLRPIVHEKIAYKLFKKEFFLITLYIISFLILGFTLRFRWLIFGQVPTSQQFRVYRIIEPVLSLAEIPCIINWFAAFFNFSCNSAHLSGWRIIIC